MLSALLGDQLDGTEPAHAQQTFESRLTLTLGGMSFVLAHVGGAHTPADSFVWMPAKQVLFAFDALARRNAQAVFIEMEFH